MYLKLAILFLLLFNVFILSLILNTKNIEFKCKAPDYNCYEDYYSKVTKTFGVKQAFADLKTRYNQDNFTKTLCHPLTHAIGRAAVETYKTVSDAYLQGDNFCSSGYYHGVLEGVAGKLGRKKLLANLDLICKDIPGKSSYSLNYYNCVHGLGHGLMAITDDELFQSLDYCGKLTGDWEQKSCASGVFMENLIADSSGHQTKYLKKDDPLYPCIQSPDKFKSACYEMQSSYINQLNGFNFVKTFETCSQAEENYRFICYNGLGRDASGFAISDVSKTKEICMLGKNYDQQLGCFVGASNDIKYYFNSAKKGKELCQSVNDPKLEADCIKFLTND